VAANDLHPVVGFRGDLAGRRSVEQPTSACLLLLISVRLALFRPSRWSVRVVLGMWLLLTSTFIEEEGNGVWF
jgi:hypothetical protein